MGKRVLDVGNCGLDHEEICQVLEEAFCAQVAEAAGTLDALRMLRSEPFDLVLVNRKLRGSPTGGVELVRRIKSDPALAATPVMLLSDLAEAQQEAEAAGAEPGFGKRDLDRPETRQKLGRFLG